MVSDIFELSHFKINIVTYYHEHFMLANDSDIGIVKQII